VLRQRRRHAVEVARVRRVLCHGINPEVHRALAQTGLEVMVTMRGVKHLKDNLPTRLLQDLRDDLAEWRTRAPKNRQAVTLC